MQTINFLLIALKQAKNAEIEASNRRADIEKQILEHYPQNKNEGTVHHDGFSVSYKLNRKVDTDMLQTAWSSLSLNAQKAFKWKADIDLRQYRAIEELDQKSFAQISNFVTSKASKPCITLTE